MLHLSLLSLPKSARWHGLTPYQTHQLVWKAFPGIEARPFLFYLEDRSTHHALLVQSTDAPDWSFLEEGDVQTRAFDASRLQMGQVLRFFVRCNPTFDRRVREGRGTRQPVGMGRRGEVHRTGDEPPGREAQIQSWLGRQGDRGGFRVERDECLVGPSVRRVITRSGEGRTPQRPIVLHEVEITGHLTITDAEVFAETLSRGIGRARSFGYGLLMLKPA